MTRFQVLSMTILLGLTPLGASMALAPAALAANDDADASMAQFFGIWDDDARVTPEAVASLYGRHVIYYGEAMTPSQVYANKRAFIRRWPDRRYSLVPGTVSKGCDPSKTRCKVDVVLRWSAASGPRHAAASGWTRVSIDLAREDGQFKIVREAGRRISRPAGI